MSQLLQKAGYIKGSGADAYMKYIATREGVEVIHGQGKPTKAQEKLIEKLLFDYPDSRSLFEYEDYLANPTLGTASDFVAAAMDYHAHEIQASDIYMRYIATRPRVEKRGDHGLFSSTTKVSLADTIDVVRSHEGNVWTIIYSLKREDAERLGFNSAERWRKLIMSHRGDFADALKIHPERLQWYAAFHDEGYHPHIHMMIWSTDPNEGYLTQKHLEKLRSRLTNDIFRDELKSVYEKKDFSYREVVNSARNTMSRLIRQMENSTYVDPEIEQKLVSLAAALKTAKGKKVYGYLPKAIKFQVDEIVDALAKIPTVAECFEEWNKMRDAVEKYYTDCPRKHLPLSQQKEFRAIKNVVIQEALNYQLGMADNSGAEKYQQRSNDTLARDNQLLPSALPGTVKLLYHMSRIFQDNSVPPANPKGMRIDSKRRKKIMQKRLAMGHKVNDHEEQSM